MLISLFKLLQKKYFKKFVSKKRRSKTATKHGIPSKNNIHPAAADAVAPSPAAVAPPAQSNLRPPSATAPAALKAGEVAGEEEEEESNEENDKDSTKKMNKKKKKKVCYKLLFAAVNFFVHIFLSKKKKKEKTSKKKKASKKHDKIEKEKDVKKKNEIIHPYSLTSSTKNEKLKDTNEKGLTIIINDELMTKENVEEQIKV
uniref:Uncharacterized protein n=1 Tax=Panagrolaimus davidi TaxID=227884 RepID=A0A914R3T2_9BILA